MAAEIILRVKVDKSQYKAFKDEVKKGIDTGGQDKVTNSLKQTGDAAKQATSRIQSLGEMLTKKIAWYSISMAITSVTTAFKDALAEIKEVDAQLYNIAKVSNKSIQEIQGVADKAYETASKYGVQASQYMEAVYEYTKAGFQDNADAMAELSTKAMLVGDTTASVADKFLIAANAAWNYGKNVDALSALVDKADYINNNYATTFEKIADSFPRVASVASMAGMSAEQTMAALGTITATTQETASRAGTALRALILNILGDTTTEVEDGVTNTQEEIDSLRKVLEVYASDVVEAADATGSLINPMEAVAALSKAYREGALTERELFTIEKALGGKLRTNQLDALLKNFETTYTSMVQGMSTALGTADKEIEIKLGSWESKSNILKNTWTEFVSKGLNADLFKKAIDWITELLDRFDGLNKILPIALGFMTSLFSPMIVNNIEKAVANIKNLKTAMSTGFRTLNEETGELQTNWTAIGTAVSLGITAVTTAYALYQNHLLKIRQDAKDQAEEASKAADTARAEFDSLIELYSAYSSAREGSDAYKTASENLAVALGKEKDAVDGLKDSYKDLVEEQLEQKLWQMSNEVNKLEQEIFTDTYTDPSLFNKNPIFKAGQSYEWVSSYENGGYYQTARAVSYDDRVTNTIDAYKAYLKEYDALTEAYSAKRREAEGEDVKWTRHWKDAYQDSLIPLAKEYYTTMSEGEITSRMNAIDGWLKEAEAVQKYLDAVEAYEKYEKAKEDFEQGKISQEELAESAKEAADAEADLADSIAEAGDEAEIAAEKQKMLSDAFSNVMGQATAATEALEKYNEALSADQAEENADALVSAASSAFEAAEKGLVDSAEVQAFGDMWFSTEQLVKFKKAGINIADALMNDPNFRRIFIAGTDEEGKTIFREGIDSAKEFVDMIKEADDNLDNILEVQDENGIWGVAAHLEETDQGLRVVVDDWALLARQFNSTEEAMKMLMNAYGLMIPGLESNKQEILDFAAAAEGLYMTFDGIRQIDIAQVMSKAFEEGATTQQVINLVSALERLQEEGEVELYVGDEEVENADDQTQELIGLLGLVDDQHYIHVNSYGAQEAKIRVDELNKALDTINGKFVSVSIGITSWAKSLIGASASGTDSAPGGATLVNEEGPELIQEGRRARIAGGGLPTITNLKKGAKVWTAKETEAILGGSNLPELFQGIHAYASGTNATVAGISRTTNAAYATYMNWINNPVDTDSLKYYRAVVSLRKSELELLEASDASITAQVTKQREIQNSIIEEIKYLQKVGGSQEDINSLAAEWYNIQTKIADMTAPKVIEASELYKNLQSSINKQISDIQDKRDAELETIEKQIEALQKAHDVQQDTNELKEKELAVTKAQQELDKAKAQRTVRVYNAAKGRWEWTYNASNVQSATESLTSAKQALTDYKNEQAYQKKIAALEAQQTTITQKYNTQIEKWQKVLDSIEEPVKSISASMKELLKYTTSDMTPTVNRIKQAFAKNGLTFDSGGVLRGLGGIKATAADEMILPPDVTKKMLSPMSTKMFSQRLDELRYIYGVAGNLAGYTNNAIGSQHNGDIYTFGNITLSKEQAKSTTVYELARMARGLRSYASAM